MANSALHTMPMDWLVNHGYGQVAVLRMNHPDSVGPHDHQFYELASIEQGRTKHQTASGVAELVSGDLIWIRPGQWHGYLQPENLGLTNCLIHPELIQRIRPWIRGSPAVSSLVGSSDRPSRLERPPLVLHADRLARSRIDSVLKSLREESHNHSDPGQSPDLIVSALLVQLFSLLAGIQRPPLLKPGISPAMHQVVRQTAHWLQEHLSEEFDLNQIAAQTRTSSAHLSRCFVRQMGLGMVAYQHRLRIRQACRLLCLTRQSVTQIAGGLGYNEVAYFSRRFKREMGISPAAYRQNLANHPERSLTLWEK